MSTPYPKRNGDLVPDYSVLAEDRQIESCVYFLGSKDGSKVKVGYASGWKQLRQRITAHEGAFGDKSQVLALVRGSIQEETKIKGYFRPYLSIKGKQEVFDTAAVLPYLTWLRDQYWVAISEDEFRNKEECRTVIPFEHWGPAPERESFRTSEQSLFFATDPWSVLPTRDITGDDYYSPERVVECARVALGGVIDLDPATHIQANQIVKAKSIYTLSQDGLAQPWYGRVYLNPPFGKYKLFALKIIEEIRRGEIEQMVIFAAARAISAWYFDPLMREANAICMMTGRETCWGVESTSPPDGYSFLNMVSGVDRFTAAFQEIGTVWRK